MKITAISAVKNPKAWGNGETLLAFFTLEYAGVQFRDCMLIRGRRSGEISAKPPKGENRLGERAVRFIDPEIRDAIAATAEKALLAVSGESEAA